MKTTKATVVLPVRLKRAVLARVVAMAERQERSAASVVREAVMEFLKARAVGPGARS